MFAQNSKKTCIYCGGDVRKVKKGEHVVQNAIGGRATLKSVCGSCNNKFSAIDKELCARSFLAVVASQELDAKLWQVWDVDHSAQNVLLEAKPNWQSSSLTLYPQIAVVDEQLHMRGDRQEMERFGVDNYSTVLIRSALRAFRHHKAGEQGWLHFERMEFFDGPFDARYSFPPRLFSPRPISELGERLLGGQKASFIVRYRCIADCRAALNALDNYQVSTRFGDYRTGVGSYLPAFRCYFNMQRVLRALLKNAVNLIAYCSNDSTIDRDAFRGVIGLIVGNDAVAMRHLATNGFVHARDTASLSKPGAHVFRLYWSNGVWTVASSFFGGRIGAQVQFAGPQHENWKCAFVTAPYNSAAEWNVDRTSFELPTSALTAQVDWCNPRDIMPSVPFVHSESIMR